MGRRLLKQREVEALVRAMMKLYPASRSELMFSNRFELVCAVALSAQTTDKAVNLVTPALFSAYPTPEAMKDAPLEHLEELLSTIGLYRNKAKHLKKMAQQLVDDFNGQVPGSREDLVTLAGVGRKTANVVLSNGFGVPAFAVDTHIERVSKRMKFVPASSTVRQVEDRMTRLLPEDLWTDAHHSILLFGRYQCTARNHDHKACLKRLAEVLKENPDASEAIDYLGSIE
ncbi:endonuclease III [Atopobacter sp. AH10]|uniref:endonuclease III n=1 Tax=Atopobacter sp. AH10 TaxID=2315861 RepID=UPI000EF28BB5|nr:endonuclease III [Atopobacter sp. AH10]RLK63311.1 endonuclease III [Atopobacter sp. AH10]